MDVVNYRVRKMRQRLPSRVSVDERRTFGVLRDESKRRLEARRGMIDAQRANAPRTKPRRHDDRDERRTKAQLSINVAIAEELFQRQLTIFATR